MFISRPTSLLASIKVSALFFVGSRTRTKCSRLTLETPPLMDGVKSEGRLYSAMSGPIRPDGRDATRRDADVLVVSWLAGWLRVVAA
jgi:hypothetical protein